MCWRPREFPCGNSVAHLVRSFQTDARNRSLTTGTFNQVVKDRIAFRLSGANQSSARAHRSAFDRPRNLTNIPRPRISSQRIRPTEFPPVFHNGYSGWRTGGLNLSAPKRQPMKANPSVATPSRTVPDWDLGPDLTLRLTTERAAVWPSARKAFHSSARHLRPSKGGRQKIEKRSFLEVLALKVPFRNRNSIWKQVSELSPVAGANQGLNPCHNTLDAGRARELQKNPPSQPHTIALGSLFIAWGRQRMQGGIHFFARSLPGWLGTTGLSESSLLRDHRAMPHCLRRLSSGGAPHETPVAQFTSRPGSRMNYRGHTLFPGSLTPSHAQMLAGQGMGMLRRFPESQGIWKLVDPLAARSSWLRLVLALKVQRHGSTDEILQGRLVDFLAFVDIDGAPEIPLEAGVE